MIVMMMVPRGYMLQWQGTPKSFSHGVSFDILVLVEKLGWYPPFFHRKDFLLSCKKDSTVCCCCCCLCFPNSSSSWFWVWSKKQMHWNEFNNSKTYSKLFVSAQAHSWLHLDTPVLVSTNSENLASPSICFLLCIISRHWKSHCLPMLRRFSLHST